MTLAPRPTRLLRLAGPLPLLAIGLAIGLLSIGFAAPASAAQKNGLIPPMPNKPSDKIVSGTKDAGKSDPNARMVMEAKELIYDYDKEIVTAVNHVDIYYDGRALQADRVAYDQKANRVHAFGNVKMTERNGDVTYADTMDVSDDFRDGFAEPLRVQTTQRTYFSATKGRRENGDVMVFDRGTYTACAPCRDNPDKPPLWQVRAKRIIWRQDEHMIYYDNATFELFGRPIAYLPFFSSPDPSVKRKSGFLGPSYTRSSEVGYGVEVPYFWVLSPSSDLTLTPMVTSEQGVMLKGLYRQQLIDGAVEIQAAGIHQLSPGKFKDEVPALINGQPADDAGLNIGPGDRTDRWAFSTKGDFDINEKWSWGWDINLLSDKFVRGDYNLWGGGSDATSQLYLQGKGDRSWFEMRAYRFYGLTRYDTQERLPWVAPVIDHNYTFEEPVAGGELSYNFNATNLYRQDNDFARYRTTFAPRKNNALVGVAGDYSRTTADLEWRRRFIDPAGQVWTPFAFARGDLIYTNPDENASTPAFLNHDQDFVLRGMAGVGLEYRYPFIALSSFGTHQIEPIAQIILRPNETAVGKLPNEDAQSLLFDDTTLFSWDKFSGYDRIEGGSRANVGAQYTFTANDGGSVRVLAGQSYSLFGKNSYNMLDPTQIGPASGLESDRSDYVGGLTFVPNSHFSFASHLRLDEKSFALRSAELQGMVNFDRIQANLIYGRYDQAPLQGYDNIREGVVGGARLFVTDKVYVEGGARYNFEFDALDRTQLGAGVNDINDCVSMNFTYIRAIDNTAQSVRISKVDHTFLLKIDFRTLGSISAAKTSSSAPQNDAFQ